MERLCIRHEWTWHWYPEIPRKYVMPETGTPSPITLPHWIAFNVPLPNDERTITYPGPVSFKSLPKCILSPIRRKEALLKSLAHSYWARFILTDFGIGCFDEKFVQFLNSFRKSNGLGHILSNPFCRSCRKWLKSILLRSITGPLVTVRLFWHFAIESTEYW